uniref:zonular occludens toxin domain-containing protein n=1 Tax=Rheinheimera sp. TaxID=1869214 RepID=UPI0040489C95
MPVWVVTGKLGGGKSLISVSRIQKYLLEGRKVATNLDIFPQHLLGIDKKNTELYRLPDIPTVHDLKAMPLGYEGDDIDESKNGLLVLDECGIFLNSREWNAPGRKEVNAHFKLLRKLRWDAIFIIQDIENLDADARRTIAEHVVYCRRLDRMRIPIVSALVKAITTYDLPLPRLHIGIVKYGTESSSMNVDQWNYYGDRLYQAYDTEQIFDPQQNIGGYDGITTILPTYYTHGRYKPIKQRFKDAIRNYKAKGIHFFSFGALAAAFTVNALVTAEPEIPKKGIWSCNDTYKQLYGSCSAKPIAPYEYYYPKPEQDPQKNDTTQPDAIQEQKEAVIYIAGWQLTNKGYQVNFVDAKGAPYYPLSYRVREMGNCVARVQIEGVTKRLTCMPDSMAFNQPATTGAAVSVAEPF